MLCATPATPANGKVGTTTIVKVLNYTKAKTPPPSACPTLAPSGTPYVLVADNQRFLDGQFTPLPGQRRRLDEGAVGGDAGVVTAATSAADDCYQACSFTGNYVVPFFYTVYQPPSGPAQCFCSQKRRRLVYAPRSRVYKVNVLATRAPTMNPTATPTGSPTAMPTVMPTTTPTVRPTTTPTQPIPTPPPGVRSKLPYQILLLCQSDPPLCCLQPFSFSHPAYLIFRNNTLQPQCCCSLSGVGCLEPPVPGTCISNVCTKTGGGTTDCNTLTCVQS